jgi:hypothetical protein
MGREGVAAAPTAIDYQYADATSREEQGRGGTGTARTHDERVVAG